MSHRDRSPDHRFYGHTRKILDQAIGVVETYRAQGLRLTVRQLYYQLVTRNVIPNHPRAYGKLGTLVTKARYAGEIPWDAIEDRTRVPRVPSEWSSIEDLAEAALDGYRLDRWEGQPDYVELWVEKDALAGVLAPIAKEHHAVLVMNRGYSSASAMYEAACRIGRHGGHGTIFYVGDHDPSGVNMDRDIAKRLDEFADGPFPLGKGGLDELYLVEVRRLALTQEQIKAHGLLTNPNPVKRSDKRAPRYIAEFGTTCWEVDALPPEVLVEVVRDAFREVIDEDALREVLDREEADKARFMKALEALK